MTTFPVDIDGYSARVVGTDFESAAFDMGTVVNITLDVDANLDMQGTLSLSLTDPQGNQAGGSETPWLLVPGENRATFSVPFTKTHQSGIHALAYCFTADFDGRRVHIVSGSRAFDAVDSVAPQVLNATLSKSTARTLTIVVRSDERTTCVVEYGEDTSYGKTVSSPVAGTAHSVTLRGLDASKTYHYRVRLTDMSGNNVVHKDMEARTSAPLAAEKTPFPEYVIGVILILFLGTVIGAMVIRRRPR